MFSNTKMNSYEKKLLLWSLAIIASALPAIPSLAQIPDGYYNSLKGKKGAELKTAIYNIIKDAKVLGYGSGKGKPGGASGILTGMSAAIYRPLLC